MKRLNPLLALVLCLTMALSACEKTTPTPAVVVSLFTPAQMARAILDSQEDTGSYASLLDGEEIFSPYLTENYGLDAQWVEKGAICHAPGARAGEVAVLLLGEDAPSKDAEKALLDYLQHRAGAFTGYAPDQAALAENGQIIVQGRYVALLICGNPVTARDAFLTCFDPGVLPPPLPAPDDAAASKAPATASAEATPDKIPENKTPEHVSPDSMPPDVVPPDAAPPDAAPPDVVPPKSKTPEPLETETQETYDHAGILSAYRSGDPSSLSPQNREIWAICTDVIATLITPGMDDWEKELAVHDWILQRAEYDTETLSQNPNAAPHPQNHTPYGLLVGGRAICSGYTSTFQLFMDLLEIECRSVSGTAYSGTADHAWNMVRLAGEWYCVDLTWNDPIGAFDVGDSIAHRYFNVTSAFLRSTDHQWDETLTPAATSTALSWPEIQGLLSDQSLSQASLLRPL